MYKDWDSHYFILDKLEDTKRDLKAHVNLLKENLLKEFLGLIPEDYENTIKRAELSERLFESEQALHRLDKMILDFRHIFDKDLYRELDKAAGRKVDY